MLTTRGCDGHGVHRRHDGDGVGYWNKERSDSSLGSLTIQALLAPTIKPWPLPDSRLYDNFAAVYRCKIWSGIDRSRPPAAPACLSRPPHHDSVTQVTLRLAGTRSLQRHPLSMCEHEVMGAPARRLNFGSSHAPIPVRLLLIDFSRVEESCTRASALVYPASWGPNSTSTVSSLPT